MKKVIYDYLSQTCFIFTLVIVLSAASNLIRGFQAMDNQGILILLCGTLLLQMLYYLLMSIHFRSYFLLKLVTYSLLYIAMLGYALFTHSISSNWQSILTATLIYGITVFSADFYYKKKTEKEAEEINDLIQDYRNRNSVYETK